MTAYQLELAIGLTVAAAGSAVVAFTTSVSIGKIQLPVTSDALESHDPFDVVEPVDVIDGFPVEEDAFWAKARTQKLQLTLLLTVIFILQAILLGWSAIEESTKAVVSRSIFTTYWLYVLTISISSISQAEPSAHMRSILFIVALSTIATLPNTFLTILPTTPPPSTLSFATYSISFDFLSYSVSFLQILACIRAFTIPLGPTLHYPLAQIYSEKTLGQVTNADKENVAGIVGCSAWGFLLFSYTTKVVNLGNIAQSLETGDLPVVPADIRATFNYAEIRKASQKYQFKVFNWTPKPGSGWALAWRLARNNADSFGAQSALAVVSAVLFYVPPYFLSKVVEYLESDPERNDRTWGYFYCAALFTSSVFVYLVTAQLWSISTTTLQVRLKTQLNTLLYAKTLVRKDLASSSSSTAKDSEEKDNTAEKKEDEENDFSSKAQVMTLMTTDVDRVADFSWHVFPILDSPIEIVVGTLFLYKLLGVSCFFGLAVTCIFLPMNHFAGKVVVSAQDNLMKARDERMALMNEVLGAIRMLKFMAWERSFEAKVLKVRARELKYQRMNYIIETLWNGIWNASPMLVTLVSFWHFTVVRGESLTPKIAFTSIIVFTELKFALSALPETFINILQSSVSLRRIENYLGTIEVAPVPPISEQSQKIALQSCTITWPQDRSQRSRPSSIASTPRNKFILMDLSLSFPAGELSLICGKLGSGKTLLLLALLGEADVLAGQLVCPRSPPDALATLSKVAIGEPWIVEGICAYVPQAAWLRNASIKENILFNLPYNEERYQQTLEVCALVADFEILEDGDESEIGERGVNLSGGQKARVSLARAVYSRASVLFLDDVLSAVDAHTAHHLYQKCLKGDLMKGRTVVLVSHHVQLCASGASYIVALDNGQVQFSGTNTEFQKSGVIRTLVQSTAGPSTEEDEDEAPIIEEVTDEVSNGSDGSSEGEGGNSEASSTVVPSATSNSKVLEKKKPRKLVEEEQRAVGRVSWSVWRTYLDACGIPVYWLLFAFIFVLGALSPVVENGWLKMWSQSVLDEDGSKGPKYYISIYAIVSGIGLVITTVRWFVLYSGSIRASNILYERLLESVLFAQIRFHDTVSRGRVLNRFGKDFEGIDSNLSDHFGRSTMYGISALTTLVTISIVGGPIFLVATLFMGSFYWGYAKVYGQTSRDMRRLDSVTRSPLYSMYGETISGVTILRAFGASSKFLRDMLRCVDTNSNPFYWMWGVNRWLSIRFNIVSSAILGLTALAAVASPGINASLAGFALTFANTITGDILFLVRRFVGLEQAMVALERVQEYTELKREPAEIVEPRPPQSWPAEGAITVDNLAIRYAPDLPDVLHDLNFDIRPGEKVGIIGRTGSGKSTLALSFFRFVEATKGRIVVDGVDIAKIGLADLRSKLTIIPQDPTILSGTLRSTLDVFDEYDDVDIYEALRRVHLIPSEDAPAEAEGLINQNVFRDLDSSVSEGGENFSTGEKQLLCMARAILKRSKVLVMDEATASVDYATDELISKTIRSQFANSTILTIAHRLRTVIDYDRIILLERGEIVEFDKPKVLLSNTESKFHALCKATGKDEFAMLKKLAHDAE